MYVGAVGDNRTVFGFSSGRNNAASQREQDYNELKKNLENRVCIYVMTGVGDVNGLVKDLKRFLTHLQGLSSRDVLKDIATVFSKVAEFSELTNKAYYGCGLDKEHRNQLIGSLLGRINSKVFNKIVLIKPVLKNDDNGKNIGVWETYKGEMQKRFPELKKGMGGRLESYGTREERGYGGSSETVVEEHLKSCLDIKYLSIEASEETKSDPVEMVTVTNKLNPEYWTYDKLVSLNHALKETTIPISVLDDLFFFVTSLDHTDSTSLPKISNVLSGVGALCDLYSRVEGFSYHTGEYPKEAKALYEVKDILISTVNNARTAASYTDNLWKTYGSKMEMLLNNNLPWKTRVFSEEQHRSPAVGITTTL